MGMAIGGANVNTNKTNTTTEADKPTDKAGLILAAIWGVNSDIKSTVRDGDTLNKERYVLLDKKMDLMTSEIKANIKDELKPIQEAIKANSPQAK